MLLKKERKMKKWIVGVFILAVVFFGLVEIFKGPEIPRILPRNVWLGKSSTVTKEYKAKYGKVRKFVVHHTAGDVRGLSTQQDYAGKIKSIYDEDKKGDIVYNYLIDPAGNIYEGRAGGNGVVGAHCKDFNTGTVGIAVLGCYGGFVGDERIDDKLTPEAQDALVRLIGWIAANNGIKELNKRKKLSGKVCDAVVGHREARNTQCPGKYIQKRLSHIQKKAQKLIGKYGRYLYQIEGEAVVYRIKNGYRERFVSEEEFVKKGGRHTRLIRISRTQLMAYPLEKR